MCQVPVEKLLEPPEVKPVQKPQLKSMNDRKCSVKHIYNLTTQPQYYVFTSHCRNPVSLPKAPLYDGALVRTVVSHQEGSWFIQGLLSFKIKLFKVLFLSRPPLTGPALRWDVSAAAMLLPFF